MPPKSQPKMTLRQYFAGQALAGLLSHDGDREGYSYVTKDAFLYADAMMKHMEES